MIIFLPMRTDRIVIASFAIMLLCATTTSCQAQSSSTSQKAQAQGTAETAVAAALWEKITTTCPIKGAASPATFLIIQGRLYEYRNASIRFYPWNVTEADRLNGTVLKGLAVLRAAAYRTAESGKQWTAFDEPDEESRHMNGPSWFGSQKIYDIHRSFEAYWPGMLVVLVEKRNDQWSFGYQGDSLLPQGMRHQPSAPKMSCATLTSTNPLAP